ncbi:MAG: hypothetical protein N3D20_00405 [Candidatus Pacearchaeota archaeon]|nr:hypothetical protein [Candidatus Pacearchaeota archaeon]
MFDWIFGKRWKRVEEETKKGFNAVREDIEAIGKWIKHLDGEDKQLFMIISELKNEINALKSELLELKNGLEVAEESQKIVPKFKKLPVVGKQTGVEVVQKVVQTPVQTGNFYDIFKSLSANERLIVFTLMNSELKLSYEDLALLLGKERATIRGQINAIKQKSEGLIEEIIEKNGKKRVFIPDEIKVKLAKYAKVRVKSEKKMLENENFSEKSEGEQKNES